MSASHFQALLGLVAVLPCLALMSFRRLDAEGRWTALTVAAIAAVFAVYKAHDILNSWRLVMLAVIFAVVVLYGFLVLRYTRRHSDPLDERLTIGSFGQE